MKYLTLFFLASALLFLGCEEQPDEQPVTSLDLTQKANFEGETFLTFKEYTYADGRTMQFNNLNFFVSDIALQTTSTGYCRAILVNVLVVCTESFICPQTSII